MQHSLVFFNTTVTISILVHDLQNCQGDERRVKELEDNLYVYPGHLVFTYVTPELRSVYSEDTKEQLRLYKAQCKALEQGFSLSPHTVQEMNLTRDMRKLVRQIIRQDPLLRAELRGRPISPTPNQSSSNSNDSSLSILRTHV